MKEVEFRQYSAQMNSKVLLCPERLATSEAQVRHYCATINRTMSFGSGHFVIIVQESRTLVKRTRQNGK